MRLYFAAEAYRSFADTLLNLLLETVKGSSADKEDIFSVDLYNLLIRMLSAALRRYV